MHLKCLWFQEKKFQNRTRRRVYTIQIKKTAKITTLLPDWRRSLNYIFLLHKKGQGLERPIPLYLNTVLNVDLFQHIFGFRTLIESSCLNLQHITQFISDSDPSYVTRRSRIWIILKIHRNFICKSGKFSELGRHIYSKLCNKNM